MSSELPQCIPLPLEEKVLLDVVQKGKDWALMHGAAMRSKTSFSSDVLQFAPFILTPTAFPRKEFFKAVELQPILNELMHWVANDYEFLKEVLSTTIKVDDFTKRLFDIYEKVLEEGVTQDQPSLGLFRSDYMANVINNNDIKQVEFNTIASSFGGISTSITPLHSFVLQELGYGDRLKDLPQNLALSGLCKAMVEAWKLINNPKGVILFVIEDVSYNICDQRFHEFEIRKSYPEITVIRRNLTELHKQSILRKDKTLVVDGYDVNLVYFRSGYDPTQYHSEREWDARLLIERSTAIKCPSINYHLAGTKKVQQALARPGILKRFLSDEIKINMINNIFTGLYALDKDEHGDAAVEMALTNPEKYVLKPQREGGGNNVYGNDIPDVLRSMDTVERSAWILMERIVPPISKGYIIRPNNQEPLEIVDLVSELGIFGAIIGDKNKIISNVQVGHMLRTKTSTTNEGGVASGSGALDSPYLID